ncbi:MAG TPA: hypothetical protein VG142_10715 [Trebonia sp.]|jgi:hypothetical protein|nr:hypothetical protein [Trebonia sp.]
MMVFDSFSTPDLHKASGIINRLLDIRILGDQLQDALYLFSLDLVQELNERPDVDEVT